MSPALDQQIRLCTSLLRSVLGGFSEGLDTPDLREARELLQADRSPAP